MLNKPDSGRHSPRAWAILKRLPVAAMQEQLMRAYWAFYNARKSLGFPLPPFEDWLIVETERHGETFKA
jgi:hypothetical protein